MAGPTDMPVHAGPSAISGAARQAVPRAVRQPGRFAFRCTMSRTDRDRQLTIDANDPALLARFWA
jgi:hypothetical protein